MSTKVENILNPNSCWNRAADDEPVFIIRANDDTAPATVTTWAVRYMQSKGGYASLTLVQREKYHEALQVAEAMRQWRIKKDEDDIPF